MHPIYHSLKQLTRDVMRREMTADEKEYYQAIMYNPENGAINHKEDVHKEIIFQSRKPGDRIWTTRKLMLISPRIYQDESGGLVMQRNPTAIRILQWPVCQDAQTPEKRRILISSIKVRTLKDPYLPDAENPWTIQRHLAGVLTYNPNFKFHFTRKALNRRKLNGTSDRLYPHVGHYTFSLTEQQAQVFHRLKVRITARRSPSLEPLYWQPEKLSRLTEIINSIKL